MRKFIILSLKKIAPGITIAGGIGMYDAVRVIVTNRYIEYGMFRLALDIAIEKLTLFVAIGVGAAIILNVCFALIRKLIHFLRHNKQPQSVGRRPRLRLKLPLAFVKTARFIVFGIAGLVVLALLVLQVLSFCMVPGSGATGKNTNVILIVVDALRADHLGCYGYQRNTSPSIDQCAQQSILFQHAYTPWPKTNPAVASIFTGLYGHSHGVVSVAQIFPRKNISLSEILREHGYYTGAMVSNINLYRPFFFHQGFHDYFEMEDKRYDLSDKAIRWLRRRSAKKQNFFLYLHYMKPHSPYTPDAPFNEAFIADAAAHYQHPAIPINTS